MQRGGALTFTGTDRLDIALHELADIAEHVNVTLGKSGCIVANGKLRDQVAGYPVKAIDTTGAGDMYAGACLYGVCQGMDRSIAAKFGNFAAAHLVQEYGARLRRLEDYAGLLSQFLRIGGGHGATRTGSGAASACPSRDTWVP